MSADESQTPILCTGCSMFYGSASSNNMCSSCYRVWLNDNPDAASAGAGKAKQAAPEATANTEETSINDLESVPAAEAGAAATGGAGAADEPPAERPVQKNRNRCFTCRKKVGLHGFECRCSYVFCGVHRYADEHNCSYDYQTAGRETLEANNPVIQADKLQRI